MSETSETPKPGHVYRHYKGGLYRVLAVARMSEERGRRVVVYESFENGEVWVRPLEDGLEDSWLDRKRWPDGKIRGRFVEEPSPSSASASASTSAKDDHVRRLRRALTRLQEVGAGIFAMAAKGSASEAEATHVWGRFHEVLVEARRVLDDKSGGESS